MTAEDKRDNFIEKVKSSSISEYGWWQCLCDSLDDKFARGFLSASGGSLGEIFSHDEEDFREAIISICEMDIWGR